MKKTLLTGFAATTVVLVMIGMAFASPVTVSTGDLGLNVIDKDSAWTYEVALSATTPSNILPASIEITHGAWTGSVYVQTYFNSSLVGGFDNTMGYNNPGPQYANFDITGLLLDGINTITFRGIESNEDYCYVIGQVDMHYDNSASGNPVPAPATIILLGSGIFGLMGVRRRKLLK